ncbi:MAG: peptide ABC transporter substrate-binding protein [Acidobacteria bacterium]|nr:peptide ABC transporter substrate-binding protein [Acidobacteriota bacterium]
MREPRTRSRLVGIAAGLFALSLIAAACSSDDSGNKSSATTEKAATGGKTGGELVDLGTFLGDPPEFLDPGLNSTLNSYQVINELYDGLTDIDASDPANPKIVPLVAKSYEANADATVWTFKIRDGEQFSNGEPVLPSSFSRAWERASNKDFAGDYSYLFNFIKGGKEKLAGTATTLAGVKADDANMTLTVTLAKPYSNFDAVAGFQLFFPMPKAVDSLKDQKEWDKGLMIGNGPYKLAQPRTDTDIVLVRNDKWGGDVMGHKKAILDKVTFKVSKDTDTAYNAFEAGEGDSANIPPGRVKEADQNYGTTLDVNILGSYHFDINQKDPSVGGAKNLKLRQAIDMAINRSEINTAVFNGSRTVSTGVTPPGIPGFKKGLCDYCKYDPQGAKAAVDEWKAAGNSQSGPIKIQFNQGSGHENVVAIMVDNLKAVGIQAVADPKPAETYFSSLAKGSCVLCRAGWFADYPTYDNFMYDLFHKDAIGGNNYSQFDDPKFNSLVDEAKQTVDKAKQGDLFNQAEKILLNDDVGVIPLLWYRGAYVYNEKKFTNFQQTNFGLVLWDQIRRK